jgi:hypothetical protein
LCEKNLKVSEMKAVPAEEMEQKRRFYWAALEDNSCGKMVQPAQNWRLKLSGSCRSSLEAFQPICPTVHLQLGANSPSLQITTASMHEERLAGTDRDH